MAHSEQHPTAIGVVTVSYGSGDVLRGFLGSIEQSSSRQLIAVVVDNKATDSSVRDLAVSHGAEYLPLESNRGYGDGMNAGVKALPPQVDWVLISNPDVALGAGSIDALVAVGESDQAIGSVGPAIITDDEVYPSARAVPSLRLGIGHALFANIWTGNPWTRAYKKASESAPMRRDAGWLSGAAVLVRRSAFEKLGGFDTDYFMYFEDVDLGYRLGKAGYRNVYEPSATVIHTGAHSTGGESARMIQAHHASARVFLSKKYRGWYLWPVRFVLGLGLSARSTLLKRRAGHH